MESFPGVASRVLQEFRTLLQHGMSLLGSTHLLQIITINMFTIHNSHGRGTTQLCGHGGLPFNRTIQHSMLKIVFCVTQGTTETLGLAYTSKAPHWVSACLPCWCSAAQSFSETLLQVNIQEQQVVTRVNVSQGNDSASIFSKCFKLKLQHIF